LIVAMLIVLSLLACDLSRFGAYSCSDYCEQVMQRTEVCTQEKIDQECAELGEEACSQASESDVSTYASQGREDWAGQSRDQMLASCQGDVETSGKSEASCQAETATINNISCQDLLGLIGALGDAAR